MIEKNPTKLI